MPHTSRALALTLASLVLASCTQRQPVVPAPAPRPAPTRSAAFDLPADPAFERAVQRDTRTRTGVPGPNYWQQWASYTLAARLDPRTKRLHGSGRVRYHNRSPDTLGTVALHLYQNLHNAQSPRNEEVPLTGGVTLSRLAAQGTPLTAGEGMGAGYVVNGTIATVRLPRPLVPGDSAELEMEWSFEVPPDGAPRMGQDGEIWWLAYWYPQVAVYDDVSGWQADPYLGNAEFYMGYGDYDVSLTMPAGWLVTATGELQNPTETLTPRTRERLAQARRSRDVVHVVGEGERGKGAITAPGKPTLTWRFAARNVRDFTFGTSDRWLWDAALALAGDANGDGAPDTTLVQSFWRPERKAYAWHKSARYAQHSIEFLSRFLWPYPYPHMTAVDGLVSCSGMEYPMLTCIGGRRDTLSLYSVTVHEIAHMWFPMMVGSDEKRHAWQDEGLTRFNQAQAMREFFDGYDLEMRVRDSYLDFARTGDEVELMRHGDRYPQGTPAYGIASYQKMATNLVSLRAILGDTTFMRAYREYGRRWRNRHPQPQDLFNSFEDVSGRDLDWFWRTWFHETWTLDLAIGAVAREGNELAVTIEKRGPAPMPVLLAITRTSGSVERLTVPVDVWLTGAQQHMVRVRDAATVAKLEIDPEQRFPDSVRGNGSWQP